MSRNAQNLNPRLHRFCRFVCVVFFISILNAPAQQTPTATNLPDAQVTIVEDPIATEDLQPVPEVVQAMVNRAITNVTGKATAKAAWNSLFTSKDVIGLKVLSSPGPNSGTRPDVVAAIVKGLIDAGFRPTNIVVWDRHSEELRIAGYYNLEKRFGIRVEGSVDAGYDDKVFYDTPLLGTLIYSDSEFGKTGTGIGRKSFVSKLVTKEITKIINITPLLHHNVVGVSGNLFSLSMGSVDNNARFSNVENLSRVVPEIYALPVLGDRVVLNVVDALICQYEGQQRGLLHYSIVLNELRFSRDAVALDVLSLEEINRQRQIADVPIVSTNIDLFLNASLLEIGISDPKHIHVNKLP